MDKPSVDCHGLPIFQKARFHTFTEEQFQPLRMRIREIIICELILLQTLPIKKNKQPSPGSKPQP